MNRAPGESMNFFIKSVKKTRNNPLNVPANYGRLMSCRIACAALRPKQFRRRHDSGKRRACDLKKRRKGMGSVALSKIVEQLDLKNVTPEVDIGKIRITLPEINRPARS